MRIIRTIFNNIYFQLGGILAAALFFAFCVVFLILVVVDCSPCLKLNPDIFIGGGYAGK